MLLQLGNRVGLKNNLFLVVRGLFWCYCSWMQTTLRMKQCYLQSSVQSLQPKMLRKWLVTLNEHAQQIMCSESCGLQRKIAQSTFLKISDQGFQKKSSCSPWPIASTTLEGQTVFVWLSHQCCVALQGCRAVSFCNWSACLRIQDPKLQHRWAQRCQCGLWWSFRLFGASLFLGETSPGWTSGCLANICLSWRLVHGYGAGMAWQQASSSPSHMHNFSFRQLPVTVLFCSAGDTARCYHNLAVVHHSLQLCFLPLRICRSDPASYDKVPSAPWVQGLKLTQVWELQDTFLMHAASLLWERNSWHRSSAAQISEISSAELKFRWGLCRLPYLNIEIFFSFLMTALSLFSIYMQWCSFTAFPQSVLQQIPLL